MDRNKTLILIIIVLVIVAAGAFLLLRRPASVCEISLSNGFVLVNIASETGSVDMQLQQDKTIRPGEMAITIRNGTLTYSDSGHVYTVTGSALVKSDQLVNYDFTITSDQFAQPQTCKN